VDAGTVTFNVQWTNDHAPGFLWSDTVWVFVDYNKNGVMERLPLLPGATLTATSPGGKVIEEPDNNQGVWVAGNARDASAFSATVQLLTATANLAGVCAYASNYPPMGKYISASEISFTGTPEYKVVLERNDESTYTVTVGKNELLLIPSGEAALSFTDKTGAPGTFTCIPMSGNIDFTVPAIISKGLAAFFEAVTSNLTAPDAATLTYTWAAPEFSPDTHTGAAYTPTAPAIPGTYPVTLTVSSEGYCDLAASKDVEVIDCIPSTVYDLEVSASGFCEGSAGVTFALSGTDDGNSYQLYRDDTAVGTLLEGDGSPATFSGFFQAGTYSARTVPGGVSCPAEMNGLHEVSELPLPANPTVTAASRCGNGTVTLYATSSGAVIDWYAEASGGTALVSGNNTYTTPSLRASTPYYAQARNSAIGCLSAERVVALATRIAPPADPTVTAASRCGTGPVTLYATSSGAVIDWYAETSGGTALVRGSNTYTTPPLVASTAYSAEARAMTTTCVSARARVQATVNNAGATGGSSAEPCGCIQGLVACADRCYSSCTFAACGTHTFTFLPNPVLAADALQACKDHGSGWTLPDWDLATCLCSMDALNGHTIIKGDFWQHDYVTLQHVMRIATCNIQSIWDQPILLPVVCIK
jgi:hypothetical protein